MTKAGEQDAAARAEQVRTVVDVGVDLLRAGEADDADGLFRKAVAEFGDDDAPEVRAQVARALAGRVEALATLERPSEALAAADDALLRFGDDADPEVRLPLAMALSFSGVLLMNAGFLDAAADRFGEAVRRSGDDTAELRRVWAAALATRARVLARLGRIEEASEALDELERGGIDLDSVAGPAAEVLFARGVVRKHEGNAAAALEAHDEVVRRFGDNPDPEVRRFAAGSLHESAGLLEQLEPGDAQRQLAAYDEVIRRYGDDADDGTRAVVASSMLSTANVLRNHRRDGEARAVDEDIVRRFAGVDDPGVARIVAAASEALEEG